MFGLRGEGGRAAQCRNSVSDHSVSDHSMGQRKAGQDQRSSHIAAETCLSLWHLLRQSPDSGVMKEAWTEKQQGKAPWVQEPPPLPTTSQKDSRMPPPPPAAVKGCHLGVLAPPLPSI